MCIDECLNICLCIMSVLSACAGHKRAPNPLELDIRVIMNCHVIARNKTQVGLWEEQ